MFFFLSEAFWNENESFGYDDTMFLFLLVSYIFRHYLQLFVLSCGLPRINNGFRYGQHLNFLSVRITRVRSTLNCNVFNAEPPPPLDIVREQYRTLQVNSYSLQSNRHSNLTSSGLPARSQVHFHSPVSFMLQNACHALSWTLDAAVYCHYCPITFRLLLKFVFNIFSFLNDFPMKCTLWSYILFRSRFYENRCKEKWLKKKTFFIFSDFWVSENPMKFRPIFVRGPKNSPNRWWAEKLELLGSSKVTTTKNYQAEHKKCGGIFPDVKLSLKF